MSEYCTECSTDFTEGQTIMSYGGELFCTEDCVAEWLLWEHRDEIKIEIYTEDEDDEYM